MTQVIDVAPLPLVLCTGGLQTYVLCPADMIFPPVLPSSLQVPHDDVTHLILFLGYFED
jgi:hypothetical protein